MSDIKNASGELRIVSRLAISIREELSWGRCTLDKSKLSVFKAFLRTIDGPSPDKDEMI